MPYFKNDITNILFIHIPKTGGTSIERYFSIKFNIHLNENNLYSSHGYFMNLSLQHLTYNQIIEYNNIFNIDFNNIKIITVVRNPYERIISDLFWFKKITIKSSKEKVFNVIKSYLLSTEYDNHNIPQHRFITNNDKELISNIHILRTETLTKEMINLGYTDFNFFINSNNIKVNYYNYLNNKSLELINNFYHDDFILFNYSKKKNLKPNQNTRNIINLKMSKIIGKRVVKPIVKPIAKRVAKPSAKPSAKRVAKPSAKPSAKPRAKPSGKPLTKSVAKPGAKPSGKPLTKLVAKSFAKLVTKSNVKSFAKIK
jgi:hypothetical protein